MELKHGVKVLPCQSSILCQFELLISQVDNAMEVLCLLLVGKVAPHHGSLRVLIIKGGNHSGNLILVKIVISAARCIFFPVLSLSSQESVLLVTPNLS